MLRIGKKTRRRWCFPTACRANTTARGIIFAAVMLGAMLNGKTVKEACAAAVRYTAKCIEETRKACGDNTIWGVKFEKCLPFLMHDVLTENDK